MSNSGVSEVGDTIRAAWLAEAPPLLQLLTASGLRSLHAVAHYHSLACPHSYSKLQVIHKLYVHILNLPLPLFMHQALTNSDLDTLEQLQPQLRCSITCTVP